MSSIFGNSCVLMQLRRLAVPSAGWSVQENGHDSSNMAECSNWKSIDAESSHKTNSYHHLTGAKRKVMMSEPRVEVAGGTSDLDPDNDEEFGCVEIDGIIRVVRGRKSILIDLSKSRINGCVKVDTRIRYALPEDPNLPRMVMFRVPTRVKESTNVSLLGIELSFRVPEGTGAAGTEEMEPRIGQGSYGSSNTVRKMPKESCGMNWHGPRADPKHSKTSSS